MTYAKFCRFAKLPVQAAGRLRGGCAGLLSVVLLLAASALMADVVYLKNGDRLTGTLVSLDGNTLLFSTAYGTKLPIDWSHVERLETDRELNVRMTDGRLLFGALRPEEEQLAIRKEDRVVGHIDNPQQISQIYPRLDRYSEPTFTGSVFVNFERERGNTDSDDREIRLDMTRRRQLWRHRLQGQLTLEKDGGSTTKDEKQGIYRIDRFLDETWYWTNNASFERNEFKDLRRRLVLGTGLGHSFWETPFSILQVEAGPAWLNEEFSSSGTNSAFGAWWYMNLRQGSSRYPLTFFHKNHLLTTNVPNDVVFTTLTGFEVDLPLRLALQAGLEWEYDNTPEEGDDADEVDSTLTLGVGYKW
jgi:putative salt-induced outer membrane protein YdiY